MADLFGEVAPISWDADGMAGTTRDGRRVEIIISTFSGRYVAIIPVHGRDVATRRSEKTVEQARLEAEAYVREST